MFNVSTKVSQSVVQALGALLADTYALAVKTQNFHWNVTGSNFQELHTLFETHYNELNASVDEIAERIRALGSPAPGSLSFYAKSTSIKEENALPKATEMTNILARDRNRLVETAKSLIKAAQSADDPVSEDLATQQIAHHEKAAWFLKSHNIN